MTMKADKMKTSALVKISVSPEELKIIEKYRKEKKEKEDNEKRIVNILEISAKYVKHLNETGGSYSYSDFTNAMWHDYGEMECHGWPAAKIYQAVLSCIAQVEKTVFGLD